MMYFKLDTAFAENTLTKMDLGNRVVIPPHSAPERLIHSSADKIDTNECTRDGKHRDSSGARLCVNAAPTCQKAHNFLLRVP